MMGICFEISPLNKSGYFSSIQGLEVDSWIIVIDILNFSRQDYSLVAQMVKNLPAMQETTVPSLG